jgi:hypothetical protein
MAKRRKPQKKSSRGEPIFEIALCDCGCGLTDWLDVRHGQRFIKGHGGLALLERRKAALQFAIEVKLIAWGFGVLTAARAAALALKVNWKRARDEMRKFGYDYLNMTWELVK